MIIRNAEIEGKLTDVLLEGGLIQAIGKNIGEGESFDAKGGALFPGLHDHHIHCLLYTSPSPRDKRQSRMPSSA